MGLENCVSNNTGINQRKSNRATNYTTKKLLDRHQDVDRGKVNKLENNIVSELVKATSNSTSQLNISHHHSNSFSVYRTQISTLNRPREYIYASSKIETKYASAAHCSASIAVTVQRICSFVKRSAISFTYIKIVPKAHQSGKREFAD